MPRISQLPSLTEADNSDEIAIVDVSSSTTKKITRGDLLKALPAIQYGGGVLNPGDNYKTFTPASDGLLTVFANGRRNNSNAADLTLRISATGTSDPLDAFGVGYGTSDGHTTAYYLATVSKGTSVTIKISVGGGSIAPGEYKFSVTPGAAMLV